jgi:thymidine kinase
VAKLYFRYGAMQSGKSNALIGIATNYQVQGKKVLILSPEKDTREKSQEGYVTSRSGAKLPCVRFGAQVSLFDVIRAHIEELSVIPLYCVLVDEAQFLTKAHVLELTNVVDTLHIPVIAFGLKNDFRNELFEGSRYLLLYADAIEEVKTVCWFCNRKATMNMRIDADGNAITEGTQVLVGDTYLPVCRTCYKKHTQRQK